MGNPNTPKADQNNTETVETRIKSLAQLSVITFVLAVMLLFSLLSFFITVMAMHHSHHTAADTLSGAAEIGFAVLVFMGLFGYFVVRFKR